MPIEDVIPLAPPEDRPPFIPPTDAQRKEAHALLVKIMTAAVRRITGAAADDEVVLRPDQMRMTANVLDAMLDREDYSAIGPTGFGKALVLCACAATMISCFGHRVIFTTESKSLIDQFARETVPLVAECTAEVTGKPFTAAQFKGFGNYLCRYNLHRLTRELSTKHTFVVASSRKSSFDADDIAEIMDEDRSILDDNLTKSIRIGATQESGRTLREIFNWSREQIDGIFDNDPTMDGSSANLHVGDVTGPRTWYKLSSTTTECVGKNCPFYEECFPHISRDRAAEADLVITTHSMPAIQVASGIKLALGSTKIGSFQHLIADEAHGLPAIIRNHGRKTLTERSISRLADTFGDCAEHLGYSTDQDRIGETIARQFTAALNRLLGTTAPDPFSKETIVRCDQIQPETLDIAVDLSEWISTMQAELRIMRRDYADDGADKLMINKVADSIESMRERVEVFGSNGSANSARWVSKPASGFHNAPPEPVWNFSPVDIQARIKSALYEADPQNPPSKIMVSATLQPDFPSLMGLSRQIEEFPSPYLETIKRNTLLYIPRPQGTDLNSMLNRYGKFDSKAHQQWAARHMAELVRANGGSALILSATSAGINVYADEIERSAHLHALVHRQVSGTDLVKVTEPWREQIDSVLVGTRSLATGLDGRGDTCTLVAIDRVARSAGNVIDDARAANISARYGLAPWPGRDTVYAGDAALVLAQSAGRLVRSVDDYGVVALLDWRMWPGYTSSYTSIPSKLYWRALHDFVDAGVITFDTDMVLQRLADQKAYRATKVAPLQSSMWAPPSLTW